MADKHPEVPENKTRGTDPNEQSYRSNYEAILQKKASVSTNNPGSYVNYSAESSGKQIGTQHEASSSADIPSTLATIVDNNFEAVGALTAIRGLVKREFDLYPLIAVVKFNITCQLPAFLSQELSDDQSLREILTLSGTSEDVFATSCHDYLRTFWPGRGPLILDWLLHSAFQIAKTPGEDRVQHGPFDPSASPHLEELRVKSHAAYDFWREIPQPSYRITNSYYAKMAFSCAADMVEVVAFVQILSWLICVLRIPSEWLTYSKPYLSCDRHGSDLFLDISCRELEVVPEANSCWHSMIPKALIAWQFPVPDRGNSGMRGMEIEFDAMALLSRVRYPLHNRNGWLLCLKGRENLLVPREVRNDCVQWHLKPNHLGEDGGIFDQFEWQSLHRLAEPSQLRLDAAKDARNFVGYCENAAIFAATQDSGFESAGPSGAHEESAQMRWCNDYVVGVQFGGLGWGGPSFTGRMQLTRSLQAPVVQEYRLLEDEVRLSRIRQTIVFDTAKNVGFLLPELSVLVTLLHIWAKNRPDAEHILPRLPFATPDQWHAKVLADKVWEAQNVRILEHTNEKEDVTIMARLKHFYLALQQRRDVVAIDRSLSTLSFPSLKFIGNKSELKGWDMLDVVNPRGRSYRRAITLDLRKTGRWCEMLDSRPDVTILFATGLKDLIRPSSPSLCANWFPIPSSTHTLALTGHMALKMSNDFGIGTGRLQVARGFYIVKTEGRDVFEGCKCDGSSTCQRVHAVSKEQKGHLVNLKPSDCLLLGNPNAWRDLPCCKSTEQDTAAQPSAPLIEDSHTPRLPSLNFDPLTMNEVEPSHAIASAP